MSLECVFGELAGVPEQGKESKEIAPVRCFDNFGSPHFLQLAVTGCPLFCCTSDLNNSCLLPPTDDFLVFC